ncbi:AAA family ATPase (plasmid) [Deinococcus sp. KNUC1210]|uniref:ATP-binding protein n=1 Tax=Deinococcus sp. KNUC1210 TaxID=2917691 RepID=UPI001EEFFDBB|nr:AAA family ATPase [Deinococcus sp. KNUC1210]ULH16963.1 AAA family ATPase [Deinococcus sp. KNUC1210]
MADLGVQPLPETQALYARIRQEVQAAPSQLPLPVPVTSPASELERCLARLPLVGRGAALTALARQRTSLLTGAAGVGKTRLLREFLGSSRALILQGTADRQAQAYAPLIELFRMHENALGSLPTELRGAVQWLMSPPELRAVQTAEAKSDPVPDSPLWPDGHAQAVQLLARALLQLQGAASGPGAVLVAEDVHLLDLPTLEVVVEVLRRGAGRVLLTARAHELQARPDVSALVGELLQEGRLVRHALNDLSEAEVGELIGALTGQSAPLFARRLYQATAGHPLFLLETLRALGESGELSVSGGLWGTPYDQQTVDYQEIPIARSVRQTILERVERLGDAARRVLHAAALASEPFGPSSLGQVCALGEWEVLELLERAETLGLVRPMREGFGFEHDLYRQALSSEIGAARRSLIHRQLARSLRQQDAEPGLIAVHLEEAGEKAAAWPYWNEAGRAALRVFAYSDALAHFERAQQALDCLRDEQEQARQTYALQSAISDIWRTLGESSPRLEALGRMRGAAARLADPELRGGSATRLAVYHTEHGEYQQAVDAAERALHDLGPLISRERQAALMIERGAAYACLERYAEAVDALTPALDLTRGAQPAQHANVLYWLGHCAFVQGDLAQARTIYEQAMHDLPPETPTRGRVLTLWRLGQAQCRLGQWHAAIRSLEEADATALRIGALPLRTSCLTALAEVYLEAGHLGQATAHLDLADTLNSQDADEQLEIAELRGRLQQARTAAARYSSS